MSAIVLLIALLTTGYTKASETCGRKLDIMFLLDGSTTVCDGDQPCRAWTSALKFCKKIVNSFTIIFIGPDDTKIAFTLMSDKFRVQWNLNGHTNVTTLLSAIDNVAYTGGVFTTLFGLPSTLSLLTEIFNPLYGDRSDALNLFICITDGIPDMTILVGSVASAGYNQLGIAAFEVCVRPGCTEEWVRAMASPPHKVNETYFMVDSYFLLDPVKDDLVNKICEYQLQRL